MDHVVKAMDAMFAHCNIARVGGVAA